MKKLLLVLSFFFISKQAFTQKKEVLSNEFSIQYNRNIFLDRYYTYFTPSNGINLQYSNLIKEFTSLGDKVNLNWGINLGYNYATPRQEIFYSSEIIQNPNDNSWVRFSDMQILSLSLQMKYNYLLTQRLQLYAAAEIGYAFIKQSSEWTWDNQLITNRINKLMLASRCGFSYDLTSKIGLVVGFQYNLFISNNSSIFFQPRLDPKKFINSSYTLSSGLYFKF